MASFDPENIITRAMFNSLYEEDYKFPEKKLKNSLISISAGIKATKNGYTFRVQNNAVLDETNPALKYAEKFRKYILNCSIY